MPHNALVTGPPRSGKTTAVDQTVALLREDGHAVGGLSAPELREDGERVGFEIVDVGSDVREVMAHVAFKDGPRVGKYRVDVPAVDRLARTALPAAVESADCVAIDEIAPMQLESDRFVRETERALESETPVLAAIAEGAIDGFPGEVRGRTDTELFVVDPDTRDRLPETVRDWLRARI